MNVFLSTGALQSRDLDEILVACRTHGYTHIEFSSGVAYCPAAAELVVQASELGPRLIHNYFPAPRESFVLNLADADPQNLCLSLDLCQRAIDLSASVNAPFYSVHSGFVLPLAPEELGRPDAQAGFGDISDAHYEEAYHRFLESVSFLAQYARAKNVRLLLENNVVTPQNVTDGSSRHFLLVTAEDFTRFFEDIEQDNVGILLDIGHLAVAAASLGFEAEAFVETHRERIEAIHLSENDGQADQNLPLTDANWFLPYLPQFADRTLVLEAYGLTPAEIEEQLDRIHHNIRKGMEAVA